jgi:hypothetical protein
MDSISIYQEENNKSMNFILLVTYLVSIIYKNILNHICIIYFMKNHGNNIPIIYGLIKDNISDENDIFHTFAAILYLILLLLQLCMTPKLATPCNSFDTSCTACMPSEPAPA